MLGSEQSAVPFPFPVSPIIPIMLMLLSVPILPAALPVPVFLALPIFVLITISVPVPITLSVPLLVLLLFAVSPVLLSALLILMPAFPLLLAGRLRRNASG